VLRVQALACWLDYAPNQANKLNLELLTLEFDALSLPADVQQAGATS
jgi:hypothetical protein